MTPSANRTSVAASLSVVQLLAANADRKGATIVNEGTANMFVICGSGGSSTDYTQKIAAAGTFVLNPGDYTGVIRAVWDAANGNARITEFNE